MRWWERMGPRSWRTFAAFVRRATGVPALVCVLALLSPGDLHAQAAPDWLLLPSTAGAPQPGERPPARAAAESLARGLAGTPRVYDPKAARARFEQNGSTEPLMVSHSDLDALARDAQMALYHVAGGLHAKAQQDVERALARADKVLESLNRESLAAQQLLDACLYLVRAFLDGKDRDRAREQALECRRLVPDVEPDGTMHPPDVIGVLAEAEADLRTRSPGSLRIESAPAGCAVFVNGRRLGNAPLELPQLGPGEYRVQAECEEGVSGRVHRVTIGSTRVVVRVDTRFDAVVQTSLDLALRYASAEDQRAHAYADAVEVGRVVGVTDIVLIAPVGQGGGAGGASGTGASGTDRLVEIERIRVSDGALRAWVRARLDAQGAIVALDAAVRALRDGERVDLTGGAPAPLVVDASPAPPPAATLVHGAAPAASGAGPASGFAGAATTPPDLAAIESDERDERDVADDDRPPHAAGIVVGAVGGAGIVAGWALWVRQFGLESTYSEQKDAGADYTSTLGDLDNGEALAPIVVGAGAVLATASLPWLLPEEQSMPVWAAIVGGAGVAAAAGGTVFLVRGANCTEFDIEGRCTDIASTTRLGAVMLETAVPMLGVPVTYWLRDAFGSDSAAASITAGPEGASLRIGGTL